MLSFSNNMAGIYWLGTLPQYRNKSIANKLTRYVINQAKQSGYNSIISQNLKPSQSLFQKIGFKPVGSLPLYIYLNK